MGGMRGSNLEAASKLTKVIKDENVLS